jgi:hypothetical protein
MLAIAAALVLLVGCASSQLNYNALDLAWSSDNLMTSQILSNLGKFQTFPYAIPSQVSIPSGSATTTYSLTPTFGGPIGPSVTTSLANSATAPLFNARTHSSVLPNGTFGLNTGDQWSQNWTLTPMEDPDQLGRLRALYRFGAGASDQHGLACEYPLVQKAQGTGTAQSSQTVNVYVSGTKAESEKPKPAPNARGNNETQYKIHNCPERDSVDIGQPDPAFLRPPGCVICNYKDNDNAEGLVPKPLSVWLEVNRSLSNRWLWNPTRPFPQDAVLLGRHGGQDLYLTPHEPIKSRGCVQQRQIILTPLECSEKEYSDFVLFVLQATLQSTSGAAGKGTPQKGGAPTPLQQPAGPAILLQ